MNMLIARFAVTVVSLVVVAQSGLAEGRKPVSYGRDVRPILAENCFFCHGQDPNQRKGDVRLDTLEGQQAEGLIVPGKPDESELIQRIFSTEKSKVMPPLKSNRHLTPEQRATLKQWVAEGAKFEGHWSFQKPVRSAVPSVSGIANPIDAFLRTKLTDKGLSPSPEADKPTLLRRVTFDLTGLPPTPDEADAFVKDASPNAYAKVVDRLMASPHYGERMALPWLDAARYADSNGFQQDGDTFQWVWRDWVVKALNTNMPFDRFTIEQLAGDLLPNATTDQKIATAFNRNHLVNGEGGAIPEEQRFNILFDRVDVTATNWLGLTMACSQCHDHKYDPVTQRDFYSLMAAFNNLSENGVAGRQSSKTRVSPPFLEVPTVEQTAKLGELTKKRDDLKSFATAAQKDWEAKVVADEKFADKELRELVVKKDAKAKKAFDEKVAPKLSADIQRTDEEMKNFRSDEIAKVMVMAEDKPRDTHILDRGEYLKPKDKVTFATPEFLPPMAKDAPRNRLGLAKWLVTPEHPLTARVAVNRMWQTYFGVGFVKTSEDFGAQSEVPLHQDLLDYLAVEFRESGWDMKALNRLIVTSATYKQSSRVTPDLLAKDPENRFYARAPRMRLPAMFLRDAALSASGLLDRCIGGKPVYPYQPEGIWEPLAITKERDFTYPMSSGADLYRRSIYTFWRRTVGPANMFDASSRQTCRVKPSVTNTPLHALTTLNDLTWTEAARVLAEKALKETPDSDTRLSFVFRRVLVRSPNEHEQRVLRKVLQQQLEVYRNDPEAAKKVIAIGKAPRNETLNPAEHAAWSSLCLALFNLDETLTRE